MFILQLIPNKTLLVRYKGYLNTKSFPNRLIYPTVTATKTNAKSSPTLIWQHTNNSPQYSTSQVAIVHHLDMPIMRQRAFHIAPGNTTFLNIIFNLNNITSLTTQLKPKPPCTVMIITSISTIKIINNQERKTRFQSLQHFTQQIRRQVENHLDLFVMSFSHFC